MAGIGTMTFYDPDSGVFAALGHGINDVDTAALIVFVFTLTDSPESFFMDFVFHVLIIVELAMAVKANKKLKALREAAAGGVEVIAMDCDITPEEMRIREPVPVEL